MSANDHEFQPDDQPPMPADGAAAKPPTPAVEPKREVALPTPVERVAEGVPESNSPAVCLPKGQSPGTAEDLAVRPQLGPGQSSLLPFSIHPSAIPENFERPLKPGALPAAATPPPAAVAPVVDSAPAKPAEFAVPRTPAIPASPSAGDAPATPTSSDPAWSPPAQRRPASRFTPPEFVRPPAPSPKISGDQNLTAAWRSFLSWPLGASLIYLLSAACILLGAALVLAPDSANELRLAERLGMVATLFTYQAAINGVCLLVCRWRRDHPDAVALSVLVTLFLAAAPAGLDTVALQRPWAALGSGLVACGMAVFVAARWQRGVGGPLPRLLMAALACGLVAADLGPGFLGISWHNDLDGLRFCWLILWALVLLSGVIFAFAARRADRDAGDAQRPLTGRSGFRWVLGLTFAVLCGLHQYLLAYACGLELGWGDFLPYVLILVVIGGELKQRLLGGNRGLARIHAVLLLPAWLALDPTVAQMNGVWLGHPCSLVPVYMELFALAIAGQAWRWRNLNVALVAVVWGSAAIATWGTGADSQTLNIASAVGFLALGWTALGVAAKNPQLLLITPLVGAVAILFIPALQVWMWENAVDPRALYGVILGCGWLAAHAAFPRVLPSLAAFLGGCALAVGAMAACFVEDSPLYAPIFATVTVAVICAGQSWWARTYAALIPGCVPAGLGVLWLLSQHRAWLLVPIAFGLLVLGARWSRRTALSA